MFPGFARALTGYGQRFKQSVRSWYTTPLSFNTRAETLARFENHVEIDRNTVDAWGIPILKIHCQFSDNEREMARDAVENLKALFHALGAEHVRVTTNLQAPRSLIHNKGTARPGAAHTA